MGLCLCVGVVLLCRICVSVVVLCDSGLKCGVSR